MYTEKILEAASVLGGDGSEGLKLLCAAAEAWILSRLREDVKPEEIEEIFILGAAMLALSAYRETGADGGVGSYSAGRVKVTCIGAEKSGDALRKRAEAMLAPYIRDGQFVFLGVRG